MLKNQIKYKSISASVLYMSSLNTGDTITQMDIADAAGVTEVTIRNRFKERSKKAITVKLEYTKIC